MRTGRKYKSLTITFTLALSLLGLCREGWAQSSGNLLENGSFEIGPNPGSFLSLSVGSNALTGWEIVLGDIDLVGTAWTAPDGNNSLDLMGHPGSGGVRQFVGTSTSSWYRLRFKLSGNLFCEAPVKSLTVVAGSETVNFDFDTTGNTANDMGWVQKEVWFKGQGISSKILLYCPSPIGFCGPAIDDVVLEEFGYQLAVGPLVAGALSTVEIFGASHGTLVQVGHSIHGGGPISTGGGDILLTRPYSTFYMPLTDSNGHSSQTVNVPIGALGMSVWIHSFDANTGKLSNGEVRVVE